ncbi:hypothetical protein RQP46_007614 [Phenoliferia psychrophenolica]
MDDRDSDSGSELPLVGHRHEKDRERTKGASSVAKGKRRALDDDRDPAQARSKGSHSSKGASRPRASSDTEGRPNKSHSRTGPTSHRPHAGPSHRPSTTHSKSKSHLSSKNPSTSRPPTFHSDDDSSSSSFTSSTSPRRARASSAPAASPRHAHTTAAGASKYKSSKQKKKKRKKDVAGEPGRVARPGDIHVQRRGANGDDSLDAQLLGMGRLAGGTPIDLTRDGSSSQSSSTSSSSSSEEDEQVEVALADKLVGSDDKFENLLRRSVAPNNLNKKKKNSKARPPPSKKAAVTANRQDDHQPHRPKSKTAPRRQAIQIELNADRTIFEYVEPNVVESRAAAADRENVDPRKDPSRLKPSEDHERWAAFSKFSADFQLDRLPPDVSLSPTSFVSTGHLATLLCPPPPLPSSPTSPPPSPPLHQSRSFNIPLSSSMSFEDLETALPQICDAIFASAEQVLLSDDDPPSPSPTTDALQFLGTYTSELASTWEPDLARRFAGTLAAQLDRLASRLDALDDDDDAQKFRLHRITIAWYELELAVRVVQRPNLVRDADASARRCDDRVKSLVDRLVKHGPRHSMYSLKEAVLELDDESEDRVVDDPSVDAWLGLVGLALRPPELDSWAFSEADFWSVLVSSTDASSKALKRSWPTTGEVTAYTAVLVCAVSQFSPTTGRTTIEGPRLHAYWPAFYRALEPLSPAVLSNDAGLSNSALARRDRYLWTLFVRTLVLVDRWSWTPDTKLLSELFDILKARHLANPSIETTPSFPPFLDSLALPNPTVQTFDPQSDTTFSLFLKLLVRLCATLPDSKARKKILVHFSPMTKGQWGRDTPEVQRGESVLVNHYSLLVTLASLAPTTAPSRLEQARRLVAFDQVDKSARISCIRTIALFANVFSRNEMNVDPVVEWLASAAKVLQDEFVELDDERRRKHGERQIKGELYHRTLLLTLVLRTVRKILEWKKEPNAPSRYPYLGLLNPAWTTDLLESSVALDPVVGREILDCLDAFFDVRTAALPARHQPALELGVSQDEFGSFDVDFDDPALNELLGVDLQAVEAEKAELQAQDRAFAETIQARIEPELFRLVGKIYAAERGPNMGDPSEYAGAVVESWTKGLAIIIDHDLSDWSPFFRYGEKSWRRITSDPIGRREVGLLLAVQVLQHDILLFSLYQDDFLEIWVASLAARRLSVQHVLLSLLLRIFTLPDFLADIADSPFEKDGDSGDILRGSFAAHRVEMFHILFRNAGRTLGGAQTDLSKQSVTNLLRAIFSAMKDNLSLDTNQDTRAPYAAFVARAIEGVDACGPSVTGTMMPDLQWLQRESQP